jgi:hypothetical protein
MKFIILAISLLAVLPVQAAMVTTQSAIDQQLQIVDKHQILAALETKEVEQKLISLGVDKAHAQARIERLTSQEVAVLNQQLEELPAGGVVGTVITVFIVLGVLDLLGVPDVFDFIDPI